MHSSIRRSHCRPDCDFEISIIKSVVRGRARLMEIAQEFQISLHMLPLNHNFTQCLVRGLREDIYPDKYLYFEVVNCKIPPPSTFLCDFSQAPSRWTLISAGYYLHDQGNCPWCCFMRVGMRKWWAQADSQGRKQHRRNRICSAFLLQYSTFFVMVEFTQGVLLMKHCLSIMSKKSDTSSLPSYGIMESFLDLFKVCAGPAHRTCLCGSGTTGEFVPRTDSCLWRCSRRATSKYVFGPVYRTIKAQSLSYFWRYQILYVSPASCPMIYQIVIMRILEFSHVHQHHPFILSHLHMLLNQSHFVN